MAEEIAVGKTKDFDMTFEQRERYLRETEKEEMRKRKQAEKSAYSRFAQQNIDRLDVLMKIADSPLATRIYLLIVKKMNQKNALVTSYQFFMEYFGVSKSSVRRAISLLESENILQIKRSGGASVYLLNPDVVWKGKGNQVQYELRSNSAADGKTQWSFKTSFWGMYQLDSDGPVLLLPDIWQINPGLPHSPLHQCTAPPGGH